MVCTLYLNKAVKKKNYDKGRKKHSTANPLASKEDNDIWENPKFNDPQSKSDSEKAGAGCEEVL